MSAQESSTLHLPWPAYESFFECTEINSKNLKVKCKLCLPKIKILSCHSAASSNLKKHLEKIHPSSVKKLEESRRTAQEKRQNSEENGEKLKQRKIIAYSDAVNIKTVSQTTCDELILSFVVNSLQPFSICDKASKGGAAFNNLITGLQPNVTVMCQKTLKLRLQTVWNTAKQKIIKTLSEVSYVAITADCWTAAKRSYIGITAHWIQWSSLQRRHAALACKRIKGRHTFDILAKVLEETFEDFNIQNKISGVTTDNGSNFVKAFRIFGEENRSREERDEEEQEKMISEVEFVEITNLLDDALQKNNEGVVLPPHMRCASHTLNLIAVKDCEKGKKVSNLKLIWRQTFSKLQSLWNKQNTSTVCADMIQKHFNVYLKSPNVTRWNSTYDACYQFKVLTSTSDGLEKLHSICDALVLPRFNRNEISFIREYVDVMKPVATALDFLQRENNMYMGYLLPTLHQTVTSLQQIQNSKQLQYCLPIIAVLTERIETRFQSIWWKRPYVVASCVHPKFKMNWINSNEKKEEAYNWVLDELDLECLYSVQMDSATASTSISSENDEDNFFTFSNCAKPNFENEYKLQLDSFLQSKEVKLHLLNNHLNVKNVFMKFNTTLPTSASVERMLASQLMFSKLRDTL